LLGGSWLRYTTSRLAVTPRISLRRPVNNYKNFQRLSTFCLAPLVGETQGEKSPTGKHAARRHSFEGRQSPVRGEELTSNLRVLHKTPFLGIPQLGSLAAMKRTSKKQVTFLKFLLCFSCRRFQNSLQPAIFVTSLANPIPLCFYALYLSLCPLL